MAINELSAYFASYGPLDGPIRTSHGPSAIVVLTDSHKGVGLPPQPKGIAYPSGFIQDDQGQVVVYRVVIGMNELLGRYACVRRRFQ